MRAPRAVSQEHSVTERHAPTQQEKKDPRRTRVFRIPNADCGSDGAGLGPALLHKTIELLLVAGATQVLEELAEGALLVLKPSALGFQPVQRVPPVGVEGGIAARALPRRLPLAHVITNQPGTRRL